MKGIRVSCLAQTGFAAFGKGVQLISRSPYTETEQLSRLTLQCVIPHDDKLGSRGEDIAYP